MNENKDVIDTKEEEKKINDAVSRASQSDAVTSNPMFGRTGLDAEGLTAEFDADAKKIYEETIKGMDDPDMISRIRREYISTVGTQHTAVAEYERSQVLNGALGAIKRRGENKRIEMFKTARMTAEAQESMNAAAAQMTSDKGRPDASMEREDLSPEKVSENLRMQLEQLHITTYQDYRSLGFSEDEAVVAATKVVKNATEGLCGDLGAAGYVKMVDDFVSHLMRNDATRVQAKDKDGNPAVDEKGKPVWDEGKINKAGALWMDMEELGKLKKNNDAVIAKRASTMAAEAEDEGWKMVADFEADITTGKYKRGDVPVAKRNEIVGKLAVMPILNNKKRLEMMGKLDETMKTFDKCDIYYSSLPKAAAFAAWEKRRDELNAKEYNHIYESTASGRFYGSDMNEHVEYLPYVDVNIERLATIDALLGRTDLTDSERDRLKEERVAVVTQKTTAENKAFEAALNKAGLGLLMSKTTDAYNNHTIAAEVYKVDRNNTATPVDDAYSTTRTSPDIILGKRGVEGAANNKIAFNQDAATAISLSEFNTAILPTLRESFVNIASNPNSEKGKADIETWIAGLKTSIANAMAVKKEGSNLSRLREAAEEADKAFFDSQETVQVKGMPVPLGVKRRKESELLKRGRMMPTFEARETLVRDTFVHDNYKVIASAKELFGDDLSDLTDVLPFTTVEEAREKVEDNFRK